MVIRSQLVRPSGSRSRCLPPVAWVCVTARPAAEGTSSWVAVARDGLSSSSWSWVTDGRSRRWPKLIWIHCPTGVLGSLSAQAVDGLPSKAFAGAYCADSPNQVPADDAVTLAV